MPVEGFDLVYAIGFLMPAAVEEIAKQQKDYKFAIVDAEVKQPNVASILFKEQEAGFLADSCAYNKIEPYRIYWRDGSSCYRTISSWIFSWC